MIATTDLNFDLDNLHPHYKWEIGKRLAICALANDYGKHDLTAMGPLYEKMKIAGNKILLDFKYVGKGLSNRDGEPLDNFIIAGADGKFIRAEAIIKDNRVEVWAADITKPVAVRFDWNEGDHSNLYNKNGLPALPFRTDNVLAKKFK
jgi:sialate O-acetylesterase